MNNNPTSDGVEYRPVPGIEGIVAGNDGSVWSSRHYGKWKRLAQHARHDGLPYRRVSIRRSKADQTVMCLYVHRLVLQAFIPQPEGANECRHLDGDVANNSLSNLAWGTHADNEEDKKRHGRILRGSKSPCAKLSENDVLAIRKAVEDGELHRVVANRYGIHKVTVSDIVRRKRWKHV